MAMSAPRPRAAANGSMRTARLAFIGLFHAFAPMVTALPMPFGDATFKTAGEEVPTDNDGERWLLLGIAVALVLAGGVFAGLTIA